MAGVASARAKQTPSEAGRYKGLVAALVETCFLTVGEAQFRAAIWRADDGSIVALVREDALRNSLSLHNAEEPLLRQVAARYIGARLLTHDADDTPARGGVGTRFTLIDEDSASPMSHEDVAALGIDPWR
jgi:hypothetical protein